MATVERVNRIRSLLNRIERPDWYSEKASGQRGLASFGWQVKMRNFLYNALYENPTASDAELIAAANKYWRGIVRAGSWRRSRVG